MISLPRLSRLALIDRKAQPVGNMSSIGTGGKILSCQDLGLKAEAVVHPNISRCSRDFYEGH